MKQKRNKPSSFLANLARTCVWCSESTTGEDIHQCKMMPSAPKRRWYDLANANKTNRIAGIGLCVMLAFWIGLLGAVLVHEAKKDKRIYMMEQTINRLTHEVDNCRINRFLPKS